MENRPVTNRPRKQPSADLETVKRRLDSDAPEEGSLEEASVLTNLAPSVLTNPAPSKKQKKLPIMIILEIAKLINPPENQNKRCL